MLNKLLLGILLIAASFFVGGVKQLSVTAAQAGETHSGTTKGGDGSGATCG